MKKEFDSIYNSIINSEDVDKMKALGSVTKGMMYKFMELSPNIAEEFLDVLRATEWKNYLTEKEAMSIVSAMVPKPTWTYQKWEQLANEDESIIISHKPCYNKCALYTTMCMISSDSGSTIVNMLQKHNVELDEKTLFKFIYELAIDKLKDVDEKFNIRTYFEL